MMRLLPFVTVMFLALLPQLAIAAPWRSIGLTDRQVLSLETHPTNSSIIIAGTDSGVYVTANRGGFWAPTTTPAVSAKFLGYDPLQISTLLMLNGGGSFSDGLYKSTNNGVSWSLVSYLAEPRRMAFDPINVGYIYICFGDGILTSTDGGLSFAPANNGLPGTNILDVAGDRQDALKAYAVGSTFVAATVNFGNQWSSLGGLFSMPNYSPLRLMPDRAAPETIYVSCKRYFARSTNSGGAWLYTLMPDSNYIALECDRNQAGRLFVGSMSGGGVLLSTDAGATFSSMSDSLDDMNVYCLRQAADGSLIAGTGGGVFINDFGVSIDDDIFAPSEFCLNIFPNPFNGSTRISYAAVGGMPVSIEIYDITGAIVRRFNPDFEPSKGYFIWDGKNVSGENVASGIYFCQLKGASVSLIKPMTLIK